MSTFDPNLEPPGDWQMPYGQPSPQSTNPQGPVAATWVWVCSGVLILMSGCCGLSGLFLMVVNTPEISEGIPADFPNRDQMIQQLPTLGAMYLVVSVVFIFIPALVLGILAFWVRKNGRAATISSLVILIILSLGVGFLLLQSMLSVIMYQMIVILLMVIVLGLILALFVKTIMALLAVLRSPTQDANYPNAW